MKKILLVLSTFFCICLSNAQENNPYEAKGKNALKDMDYLTAEIKNGNIKDCNQETIDKYKSNLASEVEMKVEMVSSIFKKYKEFDDSPESFFENNAQSEYFVQLKGMYVSFKNLNKEQLNSYLIENVNTIQENTNLSATEKANLLTTNSIAYNELARAPEGGNGGSNVWGGAVIGAGIGGYLGYNACGLLCGAGGVVVGGVVGAVVGLVVDIFSK